MIPGCLPLNGVLYCPKAMLDLKMGLLLLTAIAFTMFWVSLLAWLTVRWKNPSILISGMALPLLLLVFSLIRRFL